MDRRAFLTARRKRISATPPIATFRTESGLNPYNGPWTINEVQHLIKRTMFGSTRADLNYFLTLSMDQAVDVLLNPVATLPTPPINDYSAEIPDAAVAAGTTWVNNPQPETNEDLHFARGESFRKWWMGNMVQQDRSIREKLTLFWADHFGTEVSTIKLSQFAYQHNDLLRKSCLGNFKQLIKDVTIDPGMLRYLNGYLNSASAPDENYGRELMELFTLGKGPSVAYTEDDVRKAARVLTGWRIDPTTFVVNFDAAEHDNNSKQFSSYFGGATINGNGANEVDDLINMIFTKDEISKYIVRSIYRWFVYYEIDTATEANVISPLAAIFRSSNYDIKPLLAALFKSEHFFDVLNQGCLIKSPMDHVVGCMREFEVVFPDVATDYVDTYGMFSFLIGWTTNMGQNLGDPPDVSGFPAYYQEPQFHEIWINHDTLPKRNQFTDSITYNGFTRNGKKLIIDTIEFTKKLSNPADPNKLVEDALAIVYRVPISTASKLQIKQAILLTGQTQDYYWTNQWTTYMSDPGNMAAESIITNRLKSLYQYLMNLSEYQLS